MGIEYSVWSFAYTISRIEDLRRHIKKSYPGEKLAGVYFDLNQAIRCLNEASELYNNFLERRDKGKEG